MKETVEVKLSDIVKSLERTVESLRSDLGQAKATMIVNFGPEGRCRPWLVNPEDRLVKMVCDVAGWYEERLSEVVFVAGHVIAETDEGMVWDVLGVFGASEEAEAACYDETCFVGPLEMGRMLPREIIEWPGAYYPLADQRPETASPEL